MPVYILGRSFQIGLDSVFVCLICSDGNTPCLLVQIFSARRRCSKALGQGRIQFSCVCRHLHPNAGTTLSTNLMVKKIVLKEWKKGGIFRSCSPVSRLHQISIWNDWEGAFHLWQYERDRGTQLDQGQSEYLPASCKTGKWYVCVYW